MLKKLDASGLCNSLVKFFKSLLSCRYQYVEYKRCKSVLYSTCSGVTQGSNLGPVLFILFFNDVFSVFDSNVYVYADDLKIARPIISDRDCYCLQEDLDKFYQWCNENKLKINISKCKLITFNRKNTKIRFNYVIDGHELEEVSHIKDLGIILDQSFSFIQHIECI